MSATLHLKANRFPVVDLTDFGHAMRGVVRQLWAITLFALAPFIGLAYAICLPFAGMAVLAWTGGKAFAKSSAPRWMMVCVMDAALFIAAPFAGLFCAVTMPIIGIALIVKNALAGTRS